MRRGVMMCCLPPLCLRVPVLLWGQAYWPEHSFRRRDCPFIAKGWDISLSPNSFHSWVSPRPPSVIKFHPTSKRHTFQLAALASPPPPWRKSETLWLLIKLLAFTLSPLLDGFARVFFRLCVRGDGLMGFSGNTRSNMWILKASGLTHYLLPIVLQYADFIMFSLASKNLKVILTELLNYV